MFFFHHIGTAGSQRDFPKTVDKQVQISEFEQLIQFAESDMPRLKSRFPSGRCNAWGVPAGAASVIRQMQDGDHVLLVASIAGDGSVPVLCSNVLVLGGENWDLSEHFWGEKKFPLIFMFDTEDLDLTWTEMCLDLGFKTNYSPRLFQRIPENRLEEFGDELGYLEHIRKEWGLARSPFEFPTESDAVKAGQEILDELYEVDHQLKELQTEAKLSPELYGNNKRQLRETSPFARTGAFRLAVLRAYEWKCAVCQVSLMAPSGTIALDAAHIFPKSLDGSDDVRNGLALCALHHWAFDVGWFGLSDDWIVITRNDIPDLSSYSFIRDFEGKQLNLPRDPDLVPHQIFLQAHRLAHGFEDRPDESEQRGN